MSKLRREYRRQCPVLSRVWQRQDRSVAGAPRSGAGHNQDAERLRSVSAREPWLLRVARNGLFLRGVRLHLRPRWLCADHSCRQRHIEKPPVATRRPRATFPAKLLVWLPGANLVRSIFTPRFFERRHFLPLLLARLLAKGCEALCRGRLSHCHLLAETTSQH